MEKILITGGAGYIGSVLSERLLDLGYEVSVLDNLMYNQVSILHLFKFEKFKFIFGDVRDERLLKNLIKTSDIIIPLAAIVGMPACEKNPKLCEEINFTQIKNIVDNTSKNQKILVPNTNSQYGSSTEIITEKSPFNPLSLYAKTKCDAENYLLNSGNGISLRLATAFGVSPRMRTDLLVNDFVYKSINDGYLVLFESHFIRNYIHVQDVAETFMFMCENYQIANNEPFNVGLSNANLTKLMLANKIKQYVPELTIVENNFKEDFDKRNYIVSNEKLESLGWLPKYDLDYGINQLISAYRVLTNNLNKHYTNL